jgi:hypothetical protein
MSQRYTASHARLPSAPPSAHAQCHRRRQRSGANEYVASPFDDFILGYDVDVLFAASAGNNDKAAAQMKMDVGTDVSPPHSRERYAEPMAEQ